MAGGADATDVRSRSELRRSQPVQEHHQAVGSMPPATAGPGLPAGVLDRIVSESLAHYEEQERLRRGIERLLTTGDFQVAYQPIFDIANGECRGVEALSRFGGGLGAPEKVFAASQRLGLCVDLERLVALHVWPVLEAMPAGAFLALNLTPSTLIELARRAQKRNELPLDRLVVEVTEHSEITSYTTLRRVLAPLRERGLRVSIDDAGAGWASFRHIVELRPDFVKIDRSLVGGVTQDHARLVAVRAFVMLAQDITARVIAEGVENAEDLRVLRRAGVHMVQGHLLGRPSVNRRVLRNWIPGLSELTDTQRRAS